MSPLQRSECSGSRRSASGLTVDSPCGDAKHPVPVPPPETNDMLPVTDPAIIQSLVDHPGMLVMGVNTRGAILWLSRGLEELTGFTSDELRGRDWVETLVPAEKREEARLRCRGEIGKQRVASHVKPLLTRDKGLRHIEWVHSDVKNDHGDIVAVLCMGRDVTELLAAREALVSSENRSHAIVETAVNAILTISEDGIIESANSATERLFGYKREELYGLNVSILMPSPYREAHDSYLRNYLRTGEKKIIGIGREAVAQRKDGSLFPIDLSVGEVRLADGRRVFTGIIRELTERKVLEEKILQISEEEQHRIGQDLHDDLCQQLAAIGCLAQVAQKQLTKTKSPQSENLREIVRLVTQANVRAREMARGLMPVVLDSAGLMAALGELAQGTERIFRVSCPFRCEHPVQVLDNTMATQLFRIAQEAVANAIKHSHADRIEISLSQDATNLILSIRDNGVGIPDHVSGQRTGMGLLTMSHRARMMGGHLAATPDQFGGTLVHCTVPLAAACPGQSSASASPLNCPFSSSGL